LTPAKEKQARRKRRRGGGRQEEEKDKKRSSMRPVRQGGQRGTYAPGGV
jgi:hypothetical protein